MPLPLSADEELVIVPAPVSEEIGKSDGFVSRLHDDPEKRAGPASRDRGEGEGEGGRFDNGVEVALHWLCHVGIYMRLLLLCVHVSINLKGVVIFIKVEPVSWSQ